MLRSGTRDSAQSAAMRKVRTAHVDSRACICVHRHACAGAYRHAHSTGVMTAHETLVYTVVSICTQSLSRDVYLDRFLLVCGPIRNVEAHPPDQFHGQIFSGRLVLFSPFVAHRHWCQI